MKRLWNFLERTGVYIALVGASFTCFAFFDMFSPPFLQGGVVLVPAVCGLLGIPHTVQEWREPGQHQWIGAAAVTLITLTMLLGGAGLFIKIILGQPVGIL